MASIEEPTKTEPPQPHPGEPHQFRTECIKCGAWGQLFVAILGPDEQARIEPIEKVSSGE
jgi:hypothetical protein